MREKEIEREGGGGGRESPETLIVREAIMSKLTLQAKEDCETERKEEKCEADRHLRFFLLGVGI